MCCGYIGLVYILDIHVRIRPTHRSVASCLYIYVTCTPGIDPGTGCDCIFAHAPREHPQYSPIHVPRPGTNAKKPLRRAASYARETDLLPTTVGEGRRACCGGEEEREDEGGNTTGSERAIDERAMCVSRGEHDRKERSMREMREEEARTTRTRKALALLFSRDCGVASASQVARESRG